MADGLTEKAEDGWMEKEVEFVPGKRRRTPDCYVDSERKGNVELFEYLK